MATKRFSTPGTRGRATRAVVGLLFGAALLGGAVPVRAGAPEWLRAVAREPLPAYSEDTDAVLLLDEQEITVKSSGEIKTRYRRAYKILRPEGREHGRVEVYFDTDTRLTYLKAWCLPAQGDEYEVKEKDAVETSPFAAPFFEDTRLKIVTIPAAEPGNVVGYEYEQMQRPYILQNGWFFQDPHPVRHARFLLELPKGWEFKDFWLNYSTQQPRLLGENRWLWELQDVPEVETEPRMPPWRAVAGWMAVLYYPSRAGPQEKSLSSWRELGLWYARLAEGRRQASPPIRQKVAELTADTPTTLDKIRALANFVQRDIRYVAIAIGIGGHQPHPAPDVFTNRYGDCKDKATLLSTMLREVGVESYYLLIHTDRGFVAPNFPPTLTFNHAILAIRLPEDVPPATLFSLYEHPRLGRLLLFDPTSSLTPLGYLPASLQATYAMLVTEEGGELIRTPLLSPSANRLLRVAKLALSPNGTLAGEVQEVRWGVPAVERRAELLDAPAPERQKVLESFLAGFLGGFTLQSSQVENLEKFDDNLVLRYRFTAPNYAKAAGSLLLVRPRVLGQKTESFLERKKGKEDKPRQYPVEFDAATLQSDIVEISLPSGYSVDELPPPVEAVYEFGEYRSQAEVAGNVLRYRRDYQIKEVRVPIEKLEELKKFFRQIAADERSSVVLKRAAP